MGPGRIICIGSYGPKKQPKRASELSLWEQVARFRILVFVSFFFFFLTLLFTQAVSKDYFFLGNYWYFDIRALPSMADHIRTWSQLHFLFNVKYLRSCLHRTCTLSLASQTRYINYRKILQFFSLRLNYRPRMRHSIYLSQSERLVSNVET